MSKYDDFNTLEDFQNFINENDINSPKDFKKVNLTLYGKLSKLRLCKFVKYKHRLNDFSNFNTLEDFQKFIDENNINSPKDFEKRYTSLYVKARLLKLSKQIKYKHRLNDFSNFNTLEDFQKFIDENKITCPKEFKIVNSGLYHKLLRLHLTKFIKYEKRKKSYKEISSKDDFQKYINENKILSTHDFRVKHNSLYQKAIKRGFYQELCFPKSHFWVNHQEFQTEKDFQKFIDDNKILSPTDFKCMCSGLYRKCCDMGFSNVVRYDKRNFSKSELNILKMLSKNKIEYVLQQKFDWLKSHKGYYFSLDFYLPQYNVAIECQGRQHFSPNEYFGGEIRYKDEVDRNKQKNDLCKKNGIKIYYYVDLSLEKFNIEELKNYSLGEVYTDTKTLIEKVIYENRTQNN